MEIVERKLKGRVDSKWIKREISFFKFDSNRLVHGDERKT